MRIQPHLPVFVLLTWLAGIASGQPRPDETESDYQRRTLEEGRAAARREDNARDNAARPNQSGGSYAEQLGRQYANQWAAQAEEERNREAARQQFEHELARQREEAAQAANLRQVLQTLAEKQRLDWQGRRISLGFHTQLTRFRTGKADNEDLLSLLLFASWFPQRAELSGANQFLQAIGGSTPRERTLTALNRILQEGNILPLWHSALLDADPEGRYGVGELFGRWVHATFSPAVEPRYFLLREQIKAGLTTGFDSQLWLLADPDQVERAVLQWNDLPGSTTETGFAFAGRPTEPVIDSPEWLDPSKRPHVPALDVLASAICSGAFGDKHRSQLWRPNVERVRSWNPAYAAVFEVYARMWEDWDSSPIELEVLLRRALVAGGRPAQFAEAFLSGPRGRRHLLTERLLDAQRDPDLRQTLEVEAKRYPDALWDEWESLRFKTTTEPLPEGFFEAWHRFRQRGDSFENLIPLIQANNLEAITVAKTQAYKKGGECLYPIGQLTPDSERKRQAMRVLTVLHALCHAEPQDISLRPLQLKLGVALNDREATVAAARVLAEQTDEEISQESPDTLHALALAHAEPYGLKAEEPRMRQWVQQVLDQTGAVSPVLRPWLVPGDLVPGSERWVTRVRTLRNNLWPENASPYALEEAWRLYQTGVGLDDSVPIDNRVIGYALLGVLKSIPFAPAQAEVARIHASGSLEQKALALCGDYYVADAFTIADLFTENAQAGDAAALRALELWILLDKLPLDAVVTTYLNVIPPDRVSVIEAWMARQSLPVSQ
jgi:hypothetical protein